METVIHFTDRETATLAPLDKPERPAPGHVTGKTLYSLISTGTELNSAFLKAHTNPATAGYAAVIEIDAVAEDVVGIHSGDLAFCMHPHQSYQHVHAGQLALLPEGLDPRIAPIARLMNIGMTTLMTAKAKPGDNVLVTGAGPVGLLGALLFQRFGYRVLLCDPVPERLEAAASLGIKHTAAQPAQDDPRWRDGFSLQLECSGHESAVLDGCAAMRKGGEVVLSGVPWKRYTDHYAQELLSLVFHRYIVLRSGWEWELPLFSGDFAPHSVWSNLRNGLQWLAEGIFDPTAHCRLVAPGDAQNVYASLVERAIPELFVLFDWTNEGGGAR